MRVILHFPNQQRRELNNYPRNVDLSAFLLTHFPRSLSRRRALHSGQASKRNGQAGTPLPAVSPVRHGQTRIPRLTAPQGPGALPPHLCMPPTPTLPAPSSDRRTAPGLRAGHVTGRHHICSGGVTPARPGTSAAGRECGSQGAGAGPAAPLTPVPVPPRLQVRTTAHASGQGRAAKGTPALHGAGDNGTITAGAAVITIHSFTGGRTVGCRARQSAMNERAGRLAAVQCGRRRRRRPPWQPARKH